MNLPFTITEQSLKEKFGKFGDIEAIDIPL